MPLFVEYTKDGADGAARRNANRDAHVAYVQSANDDGKIVFSGPLKDEAGTSIGVVIIFEAADLASARRWVDGDPYVAGGVYASIDVYPVTKVFPQ